MGSVASERKPRALSKELVGSNLSSEAALFSCTLESCGEELRPAPLVYVPDLSGKIFQLLEQNDRYLFSHICYKYITGAHQMGREHVTPHVHSIDGEIQTWQTYYNYRAM